MDRSVSKSTGDTVVFQRNLEGMPVGFCSSSTRGQLSRQFPQAYGGDTVAPGSPGAVAFAEQTGQHLKHFGQVLHFVQDHQSLAVKRADSLIYNSEIKYPNCKNMIPRHATATLQSLAHGYPILALTGPRQAGKTTLAQSTFPGKPYVSLEDPDTRIFADEDPRGFLARFPDGAIVDEAQRCPALFSYLQTRVDATRRMGEFVLTGSQQFGLLSNITQSLAGRVGLVQLLPFSLQELQEGGVAMTSLDDLLWRGLYPPIHDRSLAPPQWFANYLMTYVERDVRQLIEVQNLSLFQRFLKLCAARCGQLLNMTSLGNDCGVSHKTVAAWLSVLEAGYVVFLLQPHHQNFGKRLVKTPKLYFHDTGLAAHLLGIHDAAHMAIHSARGALFENLVISELLKRRYNQGLAANLYFWRNNTGEEVDVVLEQGDKLQPVEIKSGQTFHGDFLTGLTKWARYAGDAALPSQLVYGGDMSMTRNGVAVHAWREMSKLPG